MTRAVPPPHSAAEIESEIRRTRLRIGITFHALADRLAPRRMLQKGLAMTFRIAGAARPQPRDRFRIEPLALGLIAAGLAWLVAGNLRPRRSTVVADTACAAAERAAPQHGPAAAPLLLGLLGLGVGAVLAALLPSGSRERELIARAREELWQGAESLGHQTAARLRNLAGDAGAGTTGHTPTE
jgi:Protein of unknown function (DUF3618)